MLYMQLFKGDYVHHAVETSDYKLLVQRTIQVELTTDSNSPS